MSFSLLGALPQRVYGVMTNDVLLAIPLFVFMGVMLERSRIAEELLETMGRLFGTLRGGLGISVTIVGAMMAASTGIVGATAVTMGLIVLPSMLRHGYAPALAAGTVAASATLAQIIPPSTVLVLLGDQLAHRLPGGAARAGQFRAGFGDGERPVRRRHGAGPAAGRALHPLSDRDGADSSADLPGDPAGPRRAHRVRARAPADRGAGGAAGADPCGARLDPRRRRNADRSRFGRRGRRDAAFRPPRAAWRGAASGGGEERADHLHDLRHPDRRDHVQPGVPRARRRRHGAPRARPICRGGRPAQFSW